MKNIFNKQKNICDFQNARWNIVYCINKITSNTTIDFAFYHGLMSKDESKGKYYCPDMAPKAMKAKKAAEDFKAVIDKNKNNYQRATDVSWQLLEIHRELTVLFAEMTYQKCLGNSKEACDCIEKIVEKMSETEIYIERYYDHYLYSAVIECYAEGMLGEVFSNMNL